MMVRSRRYVGLSGTFRSPTACHLHGKGHSSCDVTLFVTSPVRNCVGLLKKSRSDAPPQFRHFGFWCTDAAVGRVLSGETFDFCACFRPSPSCARKRVAWSPIIRAAVRFIISCDIRYGWCLSTSQHGIHEHARPVARSASR